jgi:hypothetical protein
LAIIFFWNGGSKKQHVFLGFIKKKKRMKKRKGAQVIASPTDNGPSPSQIPAQKLSNISFPPTTAENVSKKKNLLPTLGFLPRRGK